MSMRPQRAWPTILITSAVLVLVPALCLAADLVSGGYTKYSLIPLALTNPLTFLVSSVYVWVRYRRATLIHLVVLSLVTAVTYSVVGGLDGGTALFAAIYLVFAGIGIGLAQLAVCGRRVVTKRRARKCEEV